MRPPLVLIVDDEVTQRRLYRRLFATEGLETVLAASGEEALELLRRGPHPDLIISDIAMPGLDGVSFLKAVRADRRLAAIPAILMTGLPVPQPMLEAAAESLHLGPIFVKGGPIEELLSHAKEMIRPTEPRGLGVVVDPVKRVAWIDGRRLPALPPRRFQVLSALLGGKAMTRDELLASAWDDGDNPNAVDVAIMRLRQDLKDFPSLRIETVPSGYRLVIDRDTRGA